MLSGSVHQALNWVSDFDFAASVNGPPLLQHEHKQHAAPIHDLCTLYPASIKSVSKTQFLHTYYTIISTLDYKFLVKYLQL